jgi:hypothetical protein
MDQHNAIVAFAMLIKAGLHSGDIGKRRAHELASRKSRLQARRSEIEDCTQLQSQAALTCVDQTDG